MQRLSPKKGAKIRIRAAMRAVRHCGQRPEVHASIRPLTSSMGILDNVAVIEGQARARSRSYSCQSSTVL